MRRSSLSSSSCAGREDFRQHRGRRSCRIRATAVRRGRPAKIEDRWVRITTPSTRSALRAELGEALSREALRQSPPQVRMAPWDRGGPAVRDPGPGDLGTHPFREPADLDPARARAGLHRLQLHDPAARGRAPHGVRPAASARPSGCSGSCTRFRAASRPASSRAGTSITTRSWARTRTIPSGTTSRRK